MVLGGLVLPSFVLLFYVFSNTVFYFYCFCFWPLLLTLSLTLFLHWPLSLVWGVGPLAPRLCFVFPERISEGRFCYNLLHFCV